MTPIELKKKYNEAIRSISEKDMSVEMKGILLYVRHLHDRIEKAYDNGFKDGSKENDQIQEYLKEVKASK